MYHRVAEMPFDPWRLGVSPERFAEQLGELTRYFRVISLSELADALDRGTVPDRTVVITFDDGYRDVLESGKPTLEQYDVPATVFVASGYVGSGRNFWWDVAERACFSDRRPRQGQVQLDGLSADWSAPSDELYMSLWRQLHPLGDAPRRRLVDELARSAGIEPDADVLTMTDDDLHRLADGDLVSVGGHTVTHPNLTLLSPQEQLAEMRDSRTQLEAAIGKPVTSFCFPHGEYTGDSLELTRQAGYAETCVSVEAVVQPGRSRFEIPRWRATNLYADVFIWELSRFFRS
jgi:peptidoglycan/xylan/chitin deacetylase (PgdA/CDA1 family)